MHSPMRGGGVVVLVGVASTDGNLPTRFPHAHRARTWAANGVRCGKVRQWLDSRYSRELSRPKLGLAETGEEQIFSPYACFGPIRGLASDKLPALDSTFATLVNFRDRDTHYSRMFGTRRARVLELDCLCAPESLPAARDLLPSGARIAANPERQGRKALRRAQALAGARNMKRALFIVDAMGLDQPLCVSAYAARTH